MNKLHIAAVNSTAAPLHIDQNITEIRSHLQTLVSKNVAYVLFPELSVSGYLSTKEQVTEYAALHESALNKVVDLSKDFDITFSVGMPMPIRIGFAIAQVTLCQGEILHVHFKTHLSVHEKENFIAGNKLGTAKVGEWNIGTQICLESHYPEVSLKQQEEGAELLCFSYASPRETAEEKYERLYPMLRTRAYDNACYVMACNLTGTSASGKEYAGVAMILSPRGEVLAKQLGNESAYCIAEIDKHAIQSIQSSVMSNFPAYRQMSLVSSFKSQIHSNDRVQTEGLRPVMFVGTGSDVGKSVVAAAYCRILLQDGYNPAPFKSQNMSLNSAVSKEGGELGRAQAVQAEACNIPCHTDMNPVLLKPCTDKTAQVVLNGRPIGNYSAKSYFKGEQKQNLFKHAMESFSRLASKHNPIVIEGAGSISELNLKTTDIANMRVAVASNAATILIADIDRGGVFGSLYGSIMLLDEQERKQMKGIIINKFRGDISLFDDGRRILEELTGIPVLAVIPTFTDIYIEDEDSVSVEMKKRSAVEGKINVAVVLLRRMSNFTDFNRLDQDPRVNLFYTNNVDEVKKADIIILPGTKSTIPDLQELKANGIAAAVSQEARNGKSVIGICGGYQMMGMLIEDPEQVEGGDVATGGLAILPTTTTMEAEKQTVQSTFAYKGKPGCTGYEIHMGQTILDEGAQHLNVLEDGSTEGCIIRDNCWGSYMHGILDNPEVIEDLLAPFNVKKEEAVDYETFKQQQYDKLADHIRSVTDMEKFYEILNS